MTMETAKQILAERGLLSIRRCSICNSPVGYTIMIGELAWDGNCDCVSYSRYERREWSDLQEFLDSNPQYDGSV